MKQLINRLKCIFKKESKQAKLIKKLQSSNPNPRIFKRWEHQSWGDKISIRKAYEDGSFAIRGWLYKRPKEGDLFVYETQDGKYAKGIIHNVEYCHDPRDLFFADVIPIDYIEL